METQQMVTVPRNTWTETLKVAEAIDEVQDEMEEAGLVYWPEEAAQELLDKMIGLKKSAFKLYDDLQDSLGQSNYDQAESISVAAKSLVDVCSALSNYSAETAIVFRRLH